ncbi:hypothetical protein WIS52_18285 [Pseudonocardia nematodicida]|uniref:Uncharacterized protein n=1 Tax=Pseudonocardia nematodicida TaxID=1206997 RepID=A0ABV1KFS0_9PSEU
MTASTEQFADIAKRGQDLVTESVRSWTGAVQGVTRQFAGEARPQLPDAGAAVDRVFDFYEQVLGHQRELARTVVGAGSSLVDQWNDQAASAVAQSTEQAADTAKKAGRTTRSASA